MFNANKPTKDILTDVINVSNQHNPKFNPYSYGVLRFRDVRPEPDHGRAGASVLVSDDDSVDDRDWMRVFYQKPDISQVIKAGREIVWDPSYKQHRISSDFMDEVDNQNGLPAFQWKVGSTNLYRDVVIIEGIVSREQIFPAPTIAGITTNGTALTANITIMKDSEIYTGVTAPYTMTSAESDLTAGVTHAAITGVTINNFQITAMTITPAVFPASNETNLIQEALDENGYAIITAAYYNGVQVFDGTTEYRMVPANINAAMRLYNANPMMQGGSPVMTPSDSYLADITFYNSDDEELGSAVGRIEFNIEPQE